MPMNYMSCIVSGCVVVGCVENYIFISNSNNNGIRELEPDRQNFWLTPAL